MRSSPGTGAEDITLLEALRVDRGLNVLQVQEITGVNHKTIDRYEAALTLKPLARPLEALASFYGVRASQLLADMRRFAREREQRGEITISPDVERPKRDVLRDAA